ncbi:hypothetical protein [Actinomadura sp. 9N407]|uniref:hypothetical protein n=1 Tax=Actinomadura sp. 9N407 TaxID=3375154 RepID=UPI003797F2FD
MPERDIDASDWAEQDLLTRELARERLAQEENETTAELDALLATGRAHPAAIELLERRLDALKASKANIADGT